MDRRKIVFLLFFCFVIVTVIRLTAPSDIDNRDQAKQGLYVLDVVQKGSFIIPNELGSRPSTKPPFYTWVAAGVSLVWGKVTDLTIRLPAVLSGLGVVIITFLLAEMLFSKEVGIFAGLILIVSGHFIELSTTARTDMMLCFFISLSLYLFFVAYQKRTDQPRYSIMMFVAMGLGSITKGPVAFILPILVILVFLFFRKDLKWLKSMRLGLGVGIWLLILFGWFIPALVIGGREYFDIVVLDEMVNRFLGIGTRAEKTRPFYYLIGLFFGRYLPWSLFVPSALIRYWKSKDKVERVGLLFPVVWFLTILIFFSLSSGKRVDYLLPLYPAASVIVGQFWFGLVQREESSHWRGHLKGISMVYLLLSFFMVSILIALFVRPGLIPSIARIAQGRAESVELLQRSINQSAYLFLYISPPLAVAVVMGIVFVLRGSLKILFVILLLVTALNLSLYFEVLSPKAIRMSGELKKVFCLKAAGKINSIENLQFYNVESSILFYMGKNVRPLDQSEVLKFFDVVENPHLITTETDYLALRKRADFEFVVLEESEYLDREKTKYILLGKRRPNG